MSGAGFKLKAETIEGYEAALKAQMATGDAEDRLTARLLLAVMRPAIEVMDNHSAGLRGDEALHAVAQLALSLADSLWMTTCINMNVQGTTSLADAKTMHSTLYPRLLAGVVRIAPEGRRAFAEAIDRMGIR